MAVGVSQGSLLLSAPAVLRRSDDHLPEGHQAMERLEANTRDGIFFPLAEYFVVELYCCSK